MSRTQLTAKGAPDTRTTIGVYENVDLKISPKPPTGVTVSWTTTDGNILIPIPGDTSRAVLKNVKDPANITVTASIPGYGGVDKDFEVILPTSAIVVASVDHLPIDLIENQNGALLFEGTEFSLELLPDTVVFDNFDMKEIVPEVNWPFPDGSNFNRPPFTKEFPATYSRFSDTVAFGDYPRTTLNSPGVGPVATAYTVSDITYEYKGGGGFTPIPGMKSDHYFGFQANGKGSVALEMNGQAVANGNNMGPWQLVP